jgi:hypothetical protein
MSTHGRENDMNKDMKLKMAGCVSETGIVWLC